jgi:hypothetical protein
MRLALVRLMPETPSCGETIASGELNEAHTRCR